MKEYDNVRVFIMCILPETCFAIVKWTKCVFMLSYTNTRGINSRIRELIQQMAITEKLSIVKSNHLEGINILTNPMRHKKLKVICEMGRFIFEILQYGFN